MGTEGIRILVASAFMSRLLQGGMDPLKASEVALEQADTLVAVAMADLPQRAAARDAEYQRMKDGWRKQAAAKDEEE